MGSMTEFFMYLNTPPVKLHGVIKDLSHISVDENKKKLRRNLHLYRGEEQDKGNTED